MTLRRRIGRCRDYLTVLVADRDVPATHGASEPALWLIAVVREITAGLRAKWAAKAYVAVHFVIGPVNTDGQTTRVAVQNGRGSRASLYGLYKTRGNRRAVSGQISDMGLFVAGGGWPSPV